MKGVHSIITLTTYIKQSHVHLQFLYSCNSKKSMDKNCY